MGNQGVNGTDQLPEDICKFCCNNDLCNNDSNIDNKNETVHHNTRK